MAAQRPGKLSDINSDFRTAERQSILKCPVNIRFANKNAVCLVTMGAVDFEPRLP
jgi:hypothetical protein